MFGRYAGPYPCPGLRGAVRFALGSAPHRPLPDNPHARRAGFGAPWPGRGKSDACGRLGCLSRGKPQRQGDVRSTSPNSGQGGLEPCPQGNPNGIEPGEASGAKPQRGGGIRFFNRRGKNASEGFHISLQHTKFIELSRAKYHRIRIFH